MAVEKAIAMRSYQNFKKELLITVCFAFLPLFFALWCFSPWHLVAANLSRQFYKAFMSLFGSHHLCAFLLCNVLIVAIYSSPIGRSPDIYEESGINSEYWWSIFEYLEPETTPEEEKETESKQIAGSENISAVVPFNDDNTKMSSSEEPTGRHSRSMEELNEKEFQQIIDDFITRTKGFIIQGEEIQSKECMKEKGEEDEEDNRAITSAYMALSICR